MKTKLVYVVTSTSEATYIEQALISTYSARYHNPDAWIVLIVDDLTNQLIETTRSAILDYISEKVVIEFDVSICIKERSRLLKTDVRNIIDGDFLFIDCDTVVIRPLASVDDLSCDIGAVLGDHLYICEYEGSLCKNMNKNANIIGWDIDTEKEYFSSGVMYVKDNELTRKLCGDWNRNWKEGWLKGVYADQPALAKANIEMGHIIKRIDNRYNCIIYTQETFFAEGYILHFSAYRNPSYLFSKRVLVYIKDNGLTPFIKYAIMNPLETMFPYDSTLKKYSMSDYFRLYKVLKKHTRSYSIEIDSEFHDFKILSFFAPLVKKLLQKKCFSIASIIMVLHKFGQINILKKSAVDNVCRK